MTEIDWNKPPKHLLALFSYYQKFGKDAMTALLKSYGVETVSELDPKFYASLYDDCCREVFAGTELAGVQAMVQWLEGMTRSYPPQHESGRVRGPAAHRK
jgi:hypothetical protein